LERPFTSQELKDFIGSDKFWAVFEKQDGSKRKMLCDFKPRSRYKDAHGKWRKIKNKREKSDFEIANFLNVYDIENYGYRKINLGTLYYIRIRNNKFLVKSTVESRLDYKEPEVELEHLP
jgi:hypothetical protein